MLRMYYLLIIFFKFLNKYQTTEVISLVVAISDLLKISTLFTTDLLSGCDFPLSEARLLQAPLV